MARGGDGDVETVTTTTTTTTAKRKRGCDGVNAGVACADVGADDGGADEPNTMTTPRRRAVVCFRAELTEDIGYVDADIDRSDTWELPRTCDGCALYILPGSARWSCSRCVDFDLCTECLRVLASATASSSAAAAREKKKKKMMMKRAIHEHGAEDFICAEIADEED